MKILFIGDIVGRPGRETTKKAINKLKVQYEIDVVIANGENMAHGKGFSLKGFTELKDDVDLFTGGNHTWADQDILTEVNKADTKIIRPANFPPGNEGKGVQIIHKKGKKILVINLIGRVFFHHNYDCPFRTIDEILKDQLKNQFDAVLVDLHAEATSEKAAMRHYLDGRVTALVGTHTHVPTADAIITKQAMAYITDVGMVGPIDSIIGAEKKAILNSFLKQTPFKLDVPHGPCIFNAVMIEIEKYEAKKIEPIQLIFD